MVDGNYLPSDCRVEILVIKESSNVWRTNLAIKRLLILICTLRRNKKRIVKISI